MAFVIDSETCANCGVCEGSCGSGAITVEDEKYSIDPLKCTDCGDCSETCPLSCIVGEKK